MLQDILDCPSKYAAGTFEAVHKLVSGQNSFANLSPDEQSLLNLAVLELYRPAPAKPSVQTPITARLDPELMPRLDNWAEDVPLPALLTQPLKEDRPSISGEPDHYQPPEVDEKLALSPEELPSYWWHKPTK